MSGRRIPFLRDKLTKPPGDLAPLPEPEEKPSPIEVFAAASEETLQSLMLSRMNTAANIRKDITNLVQEMAEQIADAKLAELLLAQKQRRRENQ